MRDPLGIVPRPTGEIEVPEWAEGIEVEYLDMRVANAPHLQIRSHQDLRSWPDQRFIKDGPWYICEHMDGRARVYYHNGAIQHERNLQRFVPGMNKPESYEGLCTTQEAGFGGASIECQMVMIDRELDARTITLRGPWHYEHPDYTSVSYKIPGHMTPYAGLYITKDLFRRLVWKFREDLDILIYRQGQVGGAFVVEEIVRKEWGGQPKIALYQEHLDELRDARKASV